MISESMHYHYRDITWYFSIYNKYNVLWGEIARLAKLAKILVMMMVNVFKVFKWIREQV